MWKTTALPLSPAQHVIRAAQGMHMHVRISSHVHGCCLPILARGEGRRNGTTRHEV